MEHLRILLMGLCVFLSMQVLSTKYFLIETKESQGHSGYDGHPYKFYGHPIGPPDQRSAPNVAPAAPSAVATAAPSAVTGGHDYSDDDGGSDDGGSHAGGECSAHGEGDGGEGGGEGGGDDGGDNYMIGAREQTKVEKVEAKVGAPADGKGNDYMSSVGNNYILSNFPKGIGQGPSCDKNPDGSCA